MKLKDILQKTGWLLSCSLPLVILAVVRADDEVVALSSRVSDDYVRARRPDGSFQPEFYAFGEGGQWCGGTIDHVKFLDVARAVAGPLADKSYVATKEPKNAKLLIMVYWGTTFGASGATGQFAMQNMGVASQSLATVNSSVAAVIRSGATRSGNDRLNAAIDRDAAKAELEAFLATNAMMNRIRGERNLANARILGYNASGLFATDYGEHLEFTALRWKVRDLTEEVEANRYFVVLMAYDFQLLLKGKKHKLLWETRFSIRERGNDFSKELASMAQYASRYFGQDSHGLLRKPLPEGHVTLGDLKVIEVVPDK